jgi:hypothetical protein
MIFRYLLDVRFELFPEELGVSFFSVCLLVDEAI